MNCKKPILTVAIATYNRKEFLEECLQHVISQIEDDVEILVCDNASSDGTYKLMQEYCNKYRFIRYLKNERNIGPDGNFLRCLREGKGEYIHLLSDDDILMSNCINEVKKVIANYENLALIYLNISFFKGEFDLKKCKDKVFNINDNILFYDKNLFLEYIGILATFVSAMIFNKKYFDLIKDPEKYVGSYIFQSSILMHVISENENVLVISKVCIAGRSGNSGGYNLYQVFGYYWKKVLLETGIKLGFNKKSLKKVYSETIKNFLRQWTVFMKINNTKYENTGYVLIFKETYMYIVAWIYLYPFIIIPSNILIKLKKLYKFIKQK